MPEAVFNAASEYKKEEHVAEQMQPPPVEKHGNKNRGHAEPCRERKEGRRRIACGDQSVHEDKAVQVPAQGKFNEEGPEVRDN